MPVRAVLFDFDGVIADTENVHVAAWERTFARMGWDVPPEACERSAEVDDREFLKGIFLEHGLADGDLDGWLRHKQAATVSMLENSPRLYPGVATLIGRLVGRVQLAVVTGTWRENVTTILRASGVESAFEVIVAKEDVELTKPDPESYRQALQRLKIPASKAVAIEDSPTGLSAARAAGVRVVAVGHRHDSGRWHSEESFIDDFRDVQKTLDLLGVGRNPN